MNSSDSEQTERKTETETNDVPVLRRAAMDLLARREHSLFELRQKLQRRFPDALDLIQQVTSDLQSEGLQSDERFVENYVRYRKSRGFAYLHIKSDLQSRRVSDALIESHLFSDDEDWLYLAEDLLARKLDPHDRLSFGSKAHRRLLRLFQSRGFPAAVIRKVLDEKLCGPVPEPD